MEAHRRAYTSELHHLAAMRAQVRQACARAWGDSLEELEAIDLLALALNEAVSNIIRHSYRNEAGRPIEVAVEVDEAGATVKIAHEGAEFDPNRTLPPSFDGSRTGGFGVYLIGQAVDEVDYARDGGQCVIRLLKRRPKSSGGA